MTGFQKSEQKAQQSISQEPSTQVQLRQYPDRFEKQYDIIKIREMSLGTSDITTAGRILQIRQMGKLSFADLQDFSGRIQIALNVKTLGNEKYTSYMKSFSNGDVVGVTGDLLKTQKGELTISVKELTPLGKAYRPLPAKWEGLQDTETKWRQRYLELITTPEAKERFLKRSKVMRFIRNHLEENGFIEVETPILQHQISGANAKPFLTHHNGLDTDVVLRIAPEIFLKQLVVGGYEKVFELGKTFRNESMDPQYLQEFTMLEYYGAYWNYKDNMRFTQNLLKQLIKNVNGGNLVVNYGGEKLDFGGEWQTVTFGELVKKDSGIDVLAHRDIKALEDEVKRKGIDIEYEHGMGLGKLYDKIYKRVSRPKLIQPTIVLNYPTEMIPLARANRDNPNVLDMFQVLVNGWEIVKAYSELVDPVEQKRRFEEQAVLKKKGDQEAMDIDHEYLKAMEYGMPPISGAGIGIDRLVALLTDSQNLKETVLFPLLRKEGN